MSRFTRVTGSDPTVNRAIQELQDEVARLTRELSSAKKANSGDDVEALRTEINRKLREPNTLNFNDVFRGSGPAHAIGYVPDPGETAGTTHYLREDGVWSTLPSQLPAAASYDYHHYLAPDGTWRPLMDGLLWLLPETVTDPTLGRGTRKAGFNGSFAVASGLSADQITAREIRAVSGPITNRYGVVFDGRSVRCSGGGGTASGNLLGLGTVDWNDDTNLYVRQGTNNTQLKVTEAGLYLIVGNARSSGTSASGLIRCYIYKNGASLAYVDTGASSGGAGGFFGAVLDKAAANDYYGLRVQDPNPVQEATAKFAIIKIA